MLDNPCILMDPQTKGTKSELAQKWAKMLHNTCILGEPQTQGDKITNGPESGRKCYISAAFSRIPKKGGDKIRIGPQEGAIAT